MRGTSPTLGGTPWWREKVPHNKLWALVRAEYQRQAGRYRTIRRYQNIYEYGYKAADRSRKYDREFEEVVVSFNRSQNAVDTIISEVCSAPVAPMACTDGGTWDERDNAEKATHGLAAAFKDSEFAALEEDAFIDVCTASVGFVYIGANVQDGKLDCCRINPLDMLVDESEAYYGQPRCLYRRWVVDKHWLSERFGVPSLGFQGSAEKRKDTVLSSSRPSLLPEETWLEQEDNVVEVIEAWHLPTFCEEEEEGDEEDGDDTEADAEEEDDEEASRAPKKRRQRKTDGRHVICVERMTLVDEPHYKPYFPIWMVKPKKSRRGFWGIPIMRQLAPAQREAELLDAKIQKAHKRMGGSHILAHRDAKLALRKLTNDSGDIIEWEGQAPPAEWTPGPCHPQTYDYLERISSNMLRYIGTSQFAARSEVPQGMENSSGRALALVVDQGSKYLGPWTRERERGVVRASNLMLDAICELVEADPDYASRYVKGRGYETIKWSEIVEQRDSFVIQVEPINALSTSPAARMAQATELLKAGAIDVKRWRRISGLLDLEADNALEMATDEIIEKTLNHMVKTGKANTPEPWDDFELILDVGRKFMNMCRVQEVPNERLRVVRDYLGDTKKKLDEEKAKAAQAAQPPPGMGPPGGGMPMPMPGGPPPQGAPPGPPPMMPQQAGPPPMPQGMPNAA